MHQVPQIPLVVAMNYLMAFQGWLLIGIYGGVLLVLAIIVREFFRACNPEPVVEKNKQKIFVETKVDVEGGSVVFKGNSATKEGKIVKRLRQIRRGQ